MKTAIPDLMVNGYTVSPDLFSLGYPEGGGPCRCSSTCCMHGVYLDIAERDKILAHADLIVRQMDPQQTKDPSKWFEQDEEEDQDFPSGRCVSTQVINGQCAFLDEMGRCSLQATASNEGMHRWDLKPFYCILFPIEVSDRRIGFDTMLQDEQPCCSVSDRYRVPVFEACRDELLLLLGTDGFDRLQAHYRMYYEPQPEGTTS